MKFSPRLFRILIVCLGIFWAPLSLRPVFAVQDEQKNAGPELTESDQLLLEKLDSPLETFRTFFAAMDERDFDMARQCLDLSGFGPEVAVTKGNIYCDRLYQVLEQLWDRSFWHLPRSAANTESPFSLADSLAPRIDAEIREGAREIRLVKNSKGMWVFSQSTLAALDEKLWDRWHDPNEEALSIPVWLEQNLPKWMLKKWWLLKNYQWVCLVTLVLFGFLIGFVTRKLLNLITTIYLKLRGAQIDERPRNRLWKPISLLAHAATWYFGAKLFDLPGGLQNVLFTGFRLFAVVALVWTAYRLIDLFQTFFDRRTARSLSRFDDTLGPIIASGLKIVATVAGIVLLVNFLGWEDWAAVLGGFGVGGIAIAIAAKDVIGNFFGSLTVLWDRPFEIGDWVIIDGKVEGTIEKVGIRSSRIRTFHQSEAIVPNSILTTAVVDNMGRRDFRRFKISLQLRTDTSSDALDTFCEQIRDLLTQNSYVRQESFHVNVYDITQNSIIVLIYAFLDCDDWQAELAQRHVILTNIFRFAERLGIRYSNSFEAISLPVSHSSDAR